MPGNQVINKFCEPLYVGYYRTMNVTCFRETKAMIGALSPLILPFSKLQAIAGFTG